VKTALPVTLTFTITGARAGTLWGRIITWNFKGKMVLLLEDST
jgi:hypothetical protein